MDVKVLNKRNGDEEIKKLHSVQAKATETTCLAYVSSSDENRVLTMYMYEYSTTSNRMCPFIRMRQDLYRSFLIQSKRFHVHVSSLLNLT
jgi:hypothetical protein